MLTDGRTDDGRKVIPIAHPEQSSGELTSTDSGNIAQIIAADKAPSENFSFISKKSYVEGTH